MSQLQDKLRAALQDFLNSPYRGEWQQKTVTLTAGELQMLVAHLSIHPIETDAADPGK